MSLTMTRWRVVSPMLVAVLWACDDAPVSPERSLEPPPALTLSTTSGGPSLHSNSVKYRDAGKKPATGRSGAASLQVRALLGKNHETGLEITTGTLDDGQTPPGNLDKIQLKEMDPTGKVLSTNNYNKLRLGGYNSFGLEGLVRGSQVQVQATVSGVDPSGAAIVTVTEVVKLRPDLKVRLEAPERARPHTPVNIRAVVTELNADVGARADCVLSVDGSEVDRATGIWVDAADAVSCAFTHTFTSGGTRAVEVAVVNVAPDDWDSANNEAAGSIDVTVLADQDFSAYAEVWDFTYGNRFKSEWSWRSGTDNSGVTSGGMNVDEWGYEERFQSASMTGWMGKEVPFPLARLEVEQATNGIAVVSEVLENVGGTLWDYDAPRVGAHYRYGCVRQSRHTPAGFVRFNVCSGTTTYLSSGDSYPWTSFDQSRYAGRVTYISRYAGETWYRSTDGTCMYDGACYSWNYDNSLISGDPAIPTVGSDFTFRMAITSGGTTYVSAPRVVLQIQDYSQQDGPGCWEWAWGTDSGRNCWTTVYHAKTAWGRTWVVPAP